MIMTVIHSMEFAREGGALSGVVALKDAVRLHDQLASTDGEVKWRLVGGVDKLERAYLRLWVEAEVKLLCQRCLKPMPFRIDADTVLTQFSDEAKLDEAVAQDDDLEGILIDSELDVEVLVEDEVILALPYAPRHSECGSGDDLAERLSDAKPNPFAVLAQLKAKKQ